jgi:thioredoxin reductase
MHPDLDVIILGGGIAGLSAAQLLGRARRRTLVIDAGEPRNRTAAHVHGVLGHDGTPPADLLARGRDEASGYGVGVIEARAVAVEATDDDITVVTDDGARRTARALLVATGASDVLPAVAGLSERWGAGVLHCPYCHGWEVRDRRLGVLATSPRSLHQAQLVRQWSDDVTLFTADLGPLSIDDDLRLRARGIRLVPQRVVEIVGDGPDVTGVRLADGTMLALDAVFTGGDLTPHDDVLAGLDLPRVDSPTGSVIEVDATGRTAHPRIWAAGNVVTPMANVPMSMAAGRRREPQ